jgi:predicted transcriptional regulator
LKIYDSLKENNPKLQELEDDLLGKKPEISNELYKIIKEKDNKIKFLESKIKDIYKNKQIPRLLALLDNEDIQEKFNAFLNINEKARYYKKYE